MNSNKSKIDYLDKKNILKILYVKPKGFQRLNVDIIANKQICIYKLNFPGNEDYLK